MRASADNNTIVDQVIKLTFYQVVKNVGEGENAGYQHLSFTNNDSKALFLRVIKTQNYVAKL